MNISLSDDLQLASITMEDYHELYNLMVRTYPPAYQYLWKDDCSWYLNYLYGKAGVEEAIEEADGDFYFIKYKGENQGILKLQYNAPFPEMPDRKALRLHRIYLAEELQGKGVSHIIMEYVQGLARTKEASILWLDCMDSKHQALKYYRKYGFQTGGLSKLDYDLLIDEYRGIYLMWKEMDDFLS